MMSVPFFKLRFTLVLLFGGHLLLSVSTPPPTVNTLEIHSNCGFPGKPYRAKINPEEKLVYSDGEIVSYQCADYWAPPQSRKCVNGVWIGPPARCGDFVHDVLMKDSQLLDMSFGKPREMFHYRNMTITDTNWKYPNAFTSNRFKHARLKVRNDHEYLWKFNFTKPAVKLFVKLNVNFLNFTLLPERIKRNFTFYIDIEISPFRTCHLEYQNNNLWRDNGNRIDSYFICEAHSYLDIRRDMDRPSNYMIMRTKASHIVPYELVAVFFGRAYGNDTEPWCGEPEVEYGQSYRANQEFRDYLIDCLNRKEWKDMTPRALNNFVYTQRCIGDMLWNGTQPRCIPVKSCPLEELLNAVISNETHQNPLVIDSIYKCYNFIDNDTIYATIGSELMYSCNNVDYILVGKDTRTCKRDLTWSGTEPICKYIKSSNELIESSNYLVIVIACMGGLLFIILLASCVLFVFCTKQLKLAKKEAENNVEKGPTWNDNYYDNIELNMNQKTDNLYEIYERIEEPKDDYTRYTEPATYMYGGDKCLDGDDNYIRMVGDGRNRFDDNIRQNDCPNNAIRIRKETNKRREKEPSYLEVTGK